MIKNVLIPLFFGLLVTGCGGASNTDTAQEDTPIVDGGGDNGPIVENVQSFEIDLPVSEVTLDKIDGVWVSGPHSTFTKIDNEVLVSNSLNGNLIKLNEGYIEYKHEHPEISPTFAALSSENYLAIDDSTKGIQVYTYNNDVFDLVYAPEIPSPSISHLQVIGNCFFWESKRSDESTSSIIKTCSNGGEFTDVKFYTTEKIINGFLLLNNGTVLVQESLDFEYNFNLLDSAGVSLDKLHYKYDGVISSYDMQELGDSVYLSGSGGLYKITVLETELKDLGLVMSLSGTTGMNNEFVIAAHNNNLLYSVDDYIYYFAMSGGDITKVTKAKVNYVTGTLFVDGDTLVIHYVPSFDGSDSLGIETFSLTKF
tara:strand:- start:124 stop:1227 length:1104 start_codon:yes stop_codon:yes gene_type:complete